MLPQVKRLYTDEERRIRHREASRRYHEKNRHDLDYKGRNNARRSRYYERMKHDPDFMKRQRERGRKEYHTKVVPDARRRTLHRDSVLQAQQRRRERQQEVRKKLQQVLGGVCIECGINDYRLLDFDHINPATKTMNISQKLHLPWEVLLEEVAKCQLLCPNCHRLKTMETRQFDSRIREFRNPNRKSSFS